MSEEKEKEKENYGIYVPIKDALDKTVENIYTYYKYEYGNKEQYLETGFKNFFLRKGDLIVLASKCQMSSFISSLIYNIAFESKKTVGYISCGPNDSVAICTKLLSHITGIPKHKLVEGTLKKSEVEELRDKAGEIFDARIFINDSPNIFFEEFELAAKLMVENEKAELIIVDSFQYLNEVANADKDELPYVQGSLLKQYKEVSERLNIPVIILMALPGNDGSEPSISDFKSNMIIPRTADQVLLLHQERVQESSVECNADIITAKNAHGINLLIPLKYNPSTGIYKSDE